ALRSEGGAGPARRADAPRGGRRRDRRRPRCGGRLFPSPHRDPRDARAGARARRRSSGMTLPELVDRFAARLQALPPAPAPGRRPAALPSDAAGLAPFIDHTLLAADATPAD